ncbi:MAG: 50S ribosomal protein L9 [Rhodothalassiaceae bacterium]
MEVILLERLEKRGQIGDIISVRDGYARNFLIPQGKALRATEANKRYFETRKAEIEAQNLKRREEAQSVADKLEGTRVVLIRSAGESGQLYGSVAARDIAQELSNEGVQVTRSQVKLDKPIKSLGLFDVRIQLHAEVDLIVKVNVARSEAEAEAQFETGTAFVSRDEEDEDEDLSADTVIEDLVADAEARDETAEEQLDVASEEEDRALDA